MRHDEWMSDRNGFVKLNLRQCRELVRLIKATGRWRQVINTVRPRHGMGVARAGLPLAFLLYAASRDGRLIMKSLNGLVLLDPPMDRGREWAARPDATKWLDRLGRWWEQIVMFGPGVVLVVLGLPVGLVTQSFIFGAIVTLLGCAYFVCQMILGMLLAFLRYLGDQYGRPEQRSRSVEDHQSSGHWRITLCHVVDPDDLDGLLRAAHTRSATLSASMHKPDPADGSHVVMCLESGITTETARQAVARASWVTPLGLPDTEVYMIADPGVTLQLPEPDAKRPANILPLLLFALVAFVPGLAFQVAAVEREACTGAACAGHPTTWLTAVQWLLDRLLFQPGELTPLTFKAQLLGYSPPLVAVVMLACVVVYLVRLNEYKKRRRDLTYRVAKKTSESSMRVLILVATEIEREAVINSITVVGDGGSTRVTPVAGHAVFRLGKLGSANIYLAQSEQGTVSPAAMHLTANDLINELRPDHVILAGTCYGLWSADLDGGSQQLGDIVISKQVWCLDPRRVTGDGGFPRVISRESRVEASASLLSAFRAATHGWTGPKVHTEHVLSFNTKVDDPRFRADLRSRYEEAGAGEMELAGVYAAAARKHCDWIMVKGISDWGTGSMTDDNREAAADAAAKFLVRVITYGGLTSRRKV
jgi:nucleoside phosphorylase